MQAGRGTERQSFPHRTTREDVGAKVDSVQEPQLGLGRRRGLARGPAPPCEASRWAVSAGKTHTF